MIVRKLYLVGAMLALVGVVLVSFLGMTRMFHDEQSSSIGMGCEGGMSATCFISNTLNHLNAHGTAFRLFSLAIVSVVFLIGFVSVVSVRRWNLTAVAPPQRYISHFFETVVSTFQLRVLGWLIIHFRSIPSFS